MRLSDLFAPRRRPRAGRAPAAPSPRPPLPVGVTEHHLERGWCAALNPSPAGACRRCGASLDAARHVTRSGWLEAPRLHALAELRAGATRIIVEGAIVPVIDLELGAGEQVYCEMHTLLWKEPRVHSAVVRSATLARRMVGGMPHTLLVMLGPGRVAVSREHPGEAVVLPLDDGVEIDCREHSFLCATHTVRYGFERIGGLRAVVLGGAGLYVDRFTATNGDGLLVLHGQGNVLQRTLAEGEEILVEPGGFLYKDDSVHIGVGRVRLGHWRGIPRRMTMWRLRGPGRIGIQSMGHRHTLHRK